MNLSKSFNSIIIFERGFNNIISSDLTIVLKFICKNFWKAIFLCMRGRNRIEKTKKPSNFGCPAKLNLIKLKEVTFFYMFVVNQLNKYSFLKYMYELMVMRNYQKSLSIIRLLFEFLLNFYSHPCFSHNLGMLHKACCLDKKLRQSLIHSISYAHCSLLFGP